MNRRPKRPVLTQEGDGYEMAARIRGSMGENAMYSRFKGPRKIRSPGLWENAPSP